MTDTAAAVRAFEIQAGACAEFGSPFSATLLAAAARDIAEGGPVLALLAPWREASTRALIADATPIRWLGAAHDLALSRMTPALAAAYPALDRPGDGAAAWAAVRDLMSARPEPFEAFMAHEPQTNEVRRSICLLPGFLTVARDTGLPLRLFEIGASAGLNQLWDRYHHDLGVAGAWGDRASAVRLDTEWRGAAAPLGAEVSVACRAACDRQPVDLRDPVARRRLKAYVWADQFDRHRRLDAAIAIALAADVRVDPEDAVTWMAHRAAPVAGAATVLFHSVFWQYMPADSQATARAVIAGLGERAGAGAPFAWLRMEPAPGQMADMELRLTLWPGGHDRRLGLAHPHGAWVEWQGP